MRTGIRSLLFPLLLLTLAFTISPPVATPALASACHGATTCPGYLSCAGWSPFIDCDSTFCGYDSFCEAKGTDATLQPREKYRVCSMPGGASCTEYSDTYSFRVHCGC